MPDRKSLQLRLPLDLKDWIAKQAARNMSSQNSEVVRAINERMHRIDGSAIPTNEFFQLNFKQGSQVADVSQSWNAEGEADEGANE